MTASPTSGDKPRGADLAKQRLEERKQQRIEERRKERQASARGPGVSAPAAAKRDEPDSAS
jgi:hypothetical protein